MRVSLLLLVLLAAIALTQAWSLNDNEDAFTDGNTHLLASLTEDESPLVSTFANTGAATAGDKKGSSESGSSEDKDKKKKKKNKKNKNKKNKKKKDKSSSESEESKQKKSSTSSTPLS